MKLISYQTENSLSELCILCSKILKSNKSILIYVESSEIASNLNLDLWKAAQFLPHGTDSETFAELQPILISTNLTRRDVIVNYENSKLTHNSLQILEKLPESFVLWNATVYSGEFTQYAQKDKRWIQV